MASLEEIHSDVKAILTNQAQMKITVDSIDRGMYGDVKNKQPGLIERQELDEKRLRKIEFKQTKNAFILAAILGLATFLMNGGLDILNRIFAK